MTELNVNMNMNMNYFWNHN